MPEEFCRRGGQVTLQCTKFAYFACPDSLISPYYKTKQWPKSIAC